MAAPVGGFGLSGRGRSTTTAAAFSQHKQPATPENEVQQDNGLGRNSCAACSTSSTKEETPSSVVSRTALIGGTADETTFASDRLFVSSVAVAGVSATAAAAPASCPAPARPRGAAPYVATVTPVAAPPVCPPAGGAYGFNAASACRESHPSMSVSGADYCRSAVTAAMKGTPLPAVAQRAAGRLRSPALTAGTAPPSAAGGIQCEINSGSIPTSAEGNTLAPAESRANAAVFPAPPPRASALLGATAIRPQRRGCMFSPVSAGRLAAAEPVQSGILSAQLLPHGSRGVRVTGSVAQKTGSAVPRLASETDPLVDSSAGAPPCRPSASPVACSSPLRSPLALHRGRSNTKRRAVCLSLTGAAAHTVAPQGAATAPGPRPSSPYVGATHVAGFAQRCATAAEHDAPACSPVTASPASVVRRVSTAAAEPPAGAASAGVDVPLHNCPLTLPARRSACYTANPAFAGGTAVSASGAPAVGTGAAHGGTGVASVAGVDAAGAPPHRGSHGYKAASVLVRETLAAPTQTIQQVELLGRSQAAAAGKGAFAAVLHDSMQSVSCGSRDAAAAVSGNGVASRPSVPSAAGAGGTSPAAVAASASAGEFVGTSQGGVSTHELSLRVKPSTVNMAGIVQASSFSPAAPGPRTALRGQPQELQKPAAAAYSVVAARRTGVTAGETATAGGVPGKVNTAVIGNAGPAGDAGRATSSVAAARHVAASVGEATSRTHATAAGFPAAVALGSNCASRAPAATPAAAGFLQRTKRVPRENYRPSRRVLPYDITSRRSGISPGTPARSIGFDSRFVSQSPSVSPASALFVSSAAAASATPLAGRADSVITVSGSTAISAAAAPEMQQTEARAAEAGPSPYLRSEAPGANAAFRTPQQPQRPPWRALTPQQLLLQRASKKRLHAGMDNNSQPLPSCLRSPFPARTSLKECCRTSSNSCYFKQTGTTAVAEAETTMVVGPPAAAGAQHASAQAAQHPAAARREGVPPTLGEAAPAAELLPGAAAAGTAGGATAGEEAARANPSTAAAAGSVPRTLPAEADSCRRSDAGAPAAVASTEELCKSEARRTRKPSRLSLEAAETHNLTIAFRQQRRTSGRNTKENAAARLTAASSSPSGKCINSDSSRTSRIPCSPETAAEEVQPQTRRPPAARTKRIRAESSPKRRSVQQRQEQLQQRQQQQQLRQQEEEEWIHLTSLQQQQATTYAAALERQPVFLKSCSFTLYPPGFASSPAAVRRVCLSGTLQQPVYVPSAASLSSVQHTVERQQQEAAGVTSKCHTKVCPGAVEARTVGAACSSDSRCVIASSRCIQKESYKKVDSSSTSGSEDAVCNAASPSEKSGGSVVGFIDNTTVSGYLYHWYARMHVSAQLEAQLQQLLEARERLAQQLCDGGELHSNLFFFSLFPQDYGVEQFRHNLRFFPQYAVATAAAEAAGLQPLELYADSSCTAAIAETARRAKLAEELCEEEQLLQQHRRVAEVAAPSKEQKQCKQLQQSQQHRVQEKTVQAKETQQRKVGTQEAPEVPVVSAAAAAKLRQQDMLWGTLAKKGEESLNQVASAEKSAGGVQLSWKTASALPGTEAPGDVTGFKQDEPADPPTSGAAPRTGLQVATHATGEAEDCAESACGSPTAAVSPAGAVHSPAPGSAATSAAEGGGSKNNVPTVEATRNQTPGDSAPDNSGVADCATQKPPHSACTGTPSAGVDFTAPDVLTGKQQRLERSERKCEQQTDDVNEREKEIERLRQDVAAAMDGRAKTMSHLPSSIRAAISTAATEDAARAADAAEVRRVGAYMDEDMPIFLRSKLMHTSLEENGIQTNAVPAVKNDLSGSSHKCIRTTRCECDCKNRPTADCVSTFDTAEGATLLNGCCASTEATVQMMCGSTVPKARGDTNGNICSRRTSAYDSNSCDSGSGRCASSNCVDGRSEVVAITDVGVESSSLNNNNTSVTASRKVGNECSDLRSNRDRARVERRVEERTNANKSGGSAATSTSSTHTADGIKVGGSRTAGFVCMSPAPAGLAGAASPPAGERSSSRGGSDCRSGGSSNDGSGKTEGVAEARYFPVIPRVGTVEIASMWRLIQSSEQLLLELHQRQEQEKPPQQLEEQLPVLVKTLPIWWMGSVDLGMQQQLTALTLHRVLPGLAAWQGRDLRLIGSVLPFAARGLLALALCQLEHRIAMLQQQLAAAVGALQVLMASVLLLQQVEEYYAPPLYSLPQHVLACLYSRGGGRSVVSTSARKSSGAREGTVKLHHVAGATTNAATDGNVAGHTVDTDLQSAGSHEAGDQGREEGARKQGEAEQEKLLSTPTPSWEVGIGQGAPVALEGFVSYADAFEDYLPTLDKEETSVVSILGSDTDDASRTPAAARSVPRVGQKRSRARVAIRSANKMNNASECGTTKKRRKQLPGKRGESCTKDSNRKSGNKCRKAAAAKPHGRGSK